jgi:hypothetical protein
MDRIEGSIISPMLDSVRTITDRSHVKFPPAGEPVRDEELKQWEELASSGMKWSKVWLGAEDLTRLVATVRQLQGDLAEAKAKIIEAQQVIEGSK